MSLAYIRSASKIGQMTEVDFFAHYGETSRIVSHFNEPAERWLGAFMNFTGAMLLPSVECSTLASTRTRQIFGMAACPRTVCCHWSLGSDLAQ
jgi:hypothetical protein